MHGELASEYSYSEKVRRRQRIRGGCGDGPVAVIPLKAEVSKIEGIFLRGRRLKYKKIKEIAMKIRALDFQEMIFLINRFIISRNG